MTRRVIGIVLAGGALAMVGTALGCQAPAGGALAAEGQPASSEVQGGSSERLREDMRKLVTDARDRVFPSLVNISVVTVSHWGGKENKGGGVGSGTIISADGYVLTNQHVTNDGTKFRVTLSDRREVGAKMVGEDPLTDLAVLKINMDEIKEGKLPTAEFGDSDSLVVGDYVMAMGSPFALSRSVTLGIVSNNERVFTTGSGDEIEEMEFEAGRTGLFTSWIQHDALINPGNSGGPLVNLKGQVVGVNALGGNSMGFAIPTALARPVSQSLIKHGEVIRSDIGVALKAIKRSDFTEGVIINSVTSGAAADKAGLKAGDLIVAINGKPITVRFPEEVPPLVRMIADMPLGTKIAINYKRNGTVGEATVETEKLLKERGEQTSLRGWGVSVSQITEKMAKDRRLDNTTGALVTGLRQGSPAELAEPSMTYGDVIRKVDGHEIATLEALVEQYKTIMKQEPLPEFVMIEFDRQGKNNVTLIKPRPDKKEDPPREVPKSWIGVATQPVLKDLASKLGHGDTLGFRVTRVYPGTLAADTGLKAGDVVFAVNGEKLSPRGMQDAGMFQRRVRQLPSAEPATLSVVRGTERLEIKVPLERTRIGPDEAIKDTNKDFELTVRELTFFDRDENRWDDSVSGVLVENAERAGWAGLAGIFAGDLIQRVNQHDVKDIPSYRKAMEEIAKAQPAKVTFVVLRRTRTYFLFAEPEWKPVVVEDAKGK